MHRFNIFLSAVMLLAAGTTSVAWADWTPSWATSLQSIPQRPNLPSLYRAPDVAGKTVRQIIYPTLSGQTIRLHVSNRYGTTSLDVLTARIARSEGGSANTRDHGVAFTFAGKAALHLAPGEEADSDPLRHDLLSGSPYAISFYVGARQQLQAWHRVASQFSYVSGAGDHTNDVLGNSYKVRFTQFAWITSLLVDRPDAQAVLAIGDSITDGLRSSIGLNHRWPDRLARRIEESGNRQTAVLNAGISGNRLLSGSPCYGESLAARFEREITAAPNIRTAILLIGINDINFAIMPPRAVLDCDEPHTQVAAEDLIAGYRHMIAVAHRHHVRLLIGTLTPADLPPSREKIRLAVNDWIRGNKEADGVIDFDAALRDPAQPQRLRTADDSGDHVHPNDAGYAAMAMAVPLASLSASQTGGALSAVSPP